MNPSTSSGRTEYVKKCRTTLARITYCSIVAIRAGTGTKMKGACPLNVLAEYRRLLTTMTFLCPMPHAGSSVERLGPIRDARPGNLAGMHAIGGPSG
jgi:hypothetical protein